MLENEMCLQIRNLQRIFCAFHQIRIFVCFLFRFLGECFAVILVVVVVTVFECEYDTPPWAGRQLTQRPTRSTKWKKKFSSDRWKSLFYLSIVVFLRFCRTKKKSNINQNTRSFDNNNNSPKTKIQKNQTIHFIVFITWCAHLVLSIAHHCAKWGIYSAWTLRHFNWEKC